MSDLSRMDDAVLEGMLRYFDGLYPGSSATERWTIHLSVMQVVNELNRRAEELLAE